VPVVGQGGVVHDQACLDGDEYGVDVGRIDRHAATAPPAVPGEVGIGGGLDLDRAIGVDALVLGNRPAEQSDLGRGVAADAGRGSPRNPLAGTLALVERL